MSTAPISLESIKLHLVHNRDFTNARESVSLEELIEYLIESLEESDAAHAVKAENLLVRIGKPAVPFMLKGLKSASTTVKSVCAMALIRIGEPVVEDVKEFYVRHAARSKYRWVTEFVLAELGEAFPAAAAESYELIQPAAVLSLTHAG